MAIWGYVGSPLPKASLVLGSADNEKEFQLKKMLQFNEKCHPFLRAKSHRKLQLVIII